MNIIKARFHKKIKYDFLIDYLILYIKKKIVITYNPKSIIMIVVI